MESTVKVVLHWRRPTLSIQGLVTKRTGLLFVSFGHLYQHIYRSNLYSSVTIGAAILESVLILSRNIPGTLSGILSSLYIAIASAMACRVFRIVILEVMEDTQMDTLDIMNFYCSTTSDPRHHDDKNDQKRSFA